MTYPKGYCAIEKASGKKCGDKTLTMLICLGCGLEYSDCSKKVNEQIAWVIENFDNVNEICLSNAMELVWHDHIGVATNELFNYIDEVITSKVDEGLIKEW